MEWYFLQVRPIFPMVDGSVIYYTECESVCRGVADEEEAYLIQDQVEYFLWKGQGNRLHCQLLDIPWLTDSLGPGTWRFCLLCLGWREQGVYFGC